MKINPVKNVLVVSKIQNTEVKSDMYLTEADEDKRLIVCEVISGNDDYGKGTKVITGRYSLYQLTYHGDDYYFLDIDDVIATMSE